MKHLLLVAIALGGGCADDELGKSGPDWPPGHVPEWNCQNPGVALGDESGLTWAEPDTMTVTLDVWRLAGQDLDRTVHTEQGSGPEHGGPCAARLDDTFAVQLPIGPTMDASESQSHLLVSVTDGARTYDIATEAGIDDATVEVVCGSAAGGYVTERPSSGSLTVSKPDFETKLRFDGMVEGDCTASFSVEVRFPPDYD